MLMMQNDDSDWVSMLPVILRNYNKCWSRVTNSTPDDIEEPFVSPGPRHARRATNDRQDGAHVRAAPAAPAGPRTAAETTVCRRRPGARAAAVGQIGRLELVARGVQGCASDETTSRCQDAPPRAVPVEGQRASAGPKRTTSCSAGTVLECLKFSCQLSSHCSE
jgi:hypothetical protein